MATEKSITNNILKKLNALPKCKAIKLHGSIYSRRGTPDILCVKEGRVFFFEVKQPGRMPTASQLKELKEWGEAGAWVFIVNSWEYLERLI